MRIWILGLMLGFTVHLGVVAASETKALRLVLSETELEWVGAQVFRNECAGRHECLVHWNKGEAFPSLGIGHFIWYPEGVSDRFVESFPALVEYMKSRAVAVPRWLNATPVPGAPWGDRIEFLSGPNHDQVNELREFLAATKGMQAGFIVRRARDSLQKVVAAAPADETDLIRQRLSSLSDTPGGTYALIDYVNFKGEGLSPDERYQGQGWGLLQVLRAMSGVPEVPVLEQFREAAARVLTRRARNAQASIERERWLPGWLRRLETYREPVVPPPER
ncbi:hypothetical protein [Marinobacter sp.]|uniref:hypothetical protein n=1 Tax=Marinobacter sp. TaxID=50741 RepID=UPI0034A16FD8